MNRNRQRGMTALGWLIVLGLVGLVALITIRITPVYMEAFNVSGSLKSLRQEPYITDKSRAEIIGLLTKRFNVNGVNAVQAKQVKIDKSGGIMTLTLDYENRKHLLGNLDVVAVFHDELEIVER